MTIKRPEFRTGDSRRTANMNGIDDILADSRHDLSESEIDASTPPEYPSSETADEKHVDRKESHPFVADSLREEFRQKRYGFVLIIVVVVVALEVWILF